MQNTDAYDPPNACRPSMSEAGDRLHRRAGSCARFWPEISWAKLRQDC